MQATACALLISAALFLVACVTSDAPLLQEAAAVTPFPLQYDFVTLDANGLLKLTDEGKMEEAVFLLDGKSYRGITDPTQTLTIFPLKDHPGFYIVRDTQKQTSSYALTQMSGNRIATWFPDDAGLQAMKNAMLAMNGKSAAASEDFIFKAKDDTQLLALMNLAAESRKKMPFGILAVPYNSIPASKEGLPESHTNEDPDDPEHRSPAFWYAKGLMAEHGIANTPVNFAEAAKDYRKAAQAGIAGAMTDLARLLDGGQGIERDQAAAKDWYVKAAILGNNDAMLALGRKFLSGNGVSRSPGWAGFYLRAAAASGNVDAMKALADLLAKGDVLPADKQERLFWLVKAAEAGSKEAAKLLAAAIRVGDGTPPNQVLAATWEKKATPAPATVRFPDPPSALRGKELLAFTTRERQIFMSGFLGMLWTLGDRLRLQGLDGDCAEGYAMDNASGTSNGLTDDMDAFSRQNPEGNVSEAATSFVYDHCDARRNILLLDFYMLTFGTMKTRFADDSEDTDIFERGALSAAVQAHAKALKYETAECIERYYYDDDLNDKLRDGTKGYDEDIVTNAMMRQLDKFCP